MGQGVSQSLEPNLNQNFIKMLAFPSENKLIATACIQSQAELSKWASDLLKISKIKALPILVPQQFKTVSKFPCSEQTLLQVTYECYYINFSDEVSKRMQEQKHFQEAELWYLLLTLLEAVHICHYFQSRVGDIKPNNLLLNKEGQIKVLSKFSVPSFHDPFSQDSPKNTFYSPQELQSRRNFFKINKNNYILSQSFSIGMTMLAAGTLSNVLPVYNYQESELNLLEFNKLKKYWSEFYFYSQNTHGSVQYSRQLKRLMLSLVEIDPTKRITSLELFHILQNYKTSILALQKFTIDENLLMMTAKSMGKTQTKTHQLQSKRQSEGKDSLKNSILIPSFNNSHDISFQINIPNNSSLFNDSNEKPIRSSSHKKKLSITSGANSKKVED